MRRAPLSRSILFAILAVLAGFQLVGLTVALVSASRPRVTDFGLVGPGLGSDSNLMRLRRAGGLPVDSVFGPARAAGLGKGDVITRVDGVSMAERPGRWYAGRFATPPGTTLHLTVRRNAGTFDTALTTAPLREPLRRPISSERGATATMDYRVWHWWEWGPSLLIAGLMFLIGLVLGSLRRHDSTAWTFALVFLGISLATSMSSEMPLLHAWPPALLLFWRLSAIAGVAYAMPLTLVGLTHFPVATRISRRLWPWRWVPFVMFGLPSLVVMASLVANHSAAGPPAWLARITEPAYRLSQFALASSFAFMGLLLAAHRLERRAPAPGGRARMRVLWYGAMGVVVGGLWSVMIPRPFWFALLRPWGTTGAWLALLLRDAVPALLVCLAPLSFAYAILARRLFGIRLVLRRGLQHLLLSRAVLAIEGVLLFLVLEQSIRRGAALAGVRGPALAGGLALLVISGIAMVNRPLMQALDRRFFRDRYDARRVMLGLAQELARLHERDEIVRRIGEAVQSALHPSRTQILLPVENGTLEPAWCSPGWGAGCAAGDREAISIAASLRAAPERPWIVIDSAGEPAANHPDALERGHVEVGMAGAEEPPCCELLIPLHPARDRTGAIALSAKLSEEPYTSEDRELLMTVAHQASLALENAELLAVARREAQLAREVEIARDVQRNLFPRELPQVPGWEVAAVCRPARSVAGDYYDVLPTAGGGIGVALGDVSGKGVGASLLSAGLHAMVRSRLPAADCDLARLLADLNLHLLDSSAAEMFATLVLARLDAAAGRLTYVNAGHPPPLSVAAGGPRWLEEGGPLAGVIPGASYTPGEVRLERGDLVVIYSDGVTEAERPGREMFGDQRLLDAVSAARDRPAAGVLAAVLAAVEAFAGGEEQADDISVIVIRRPA